MPTRPSHAPAQQRPHTSYATRTLALGAMAMAMLLLPPACGDEVQSAGPAASNAASSGAGGRLSCTTYQECPDPGEDCTTPACLEGACQLQDIAAGTACDDDGGEVCNGAGRCVASNVAWSSLASAGAPSARYLHSAVWTGEKMIVWGGRTPTVTNSGALYDPQSDSWTPTSGNGAPEARHSHSAVWTGTHMLVWGGFGESDFISSGALYDPQNDSWQAINSAGAPQGRTRHSTVWTGSEMIVFGGLRGIDALAGGARYHVANDSWQDLDSGGAPSRRMAHAAVWTGDEMILWGGSDTFDWLDDGAIYDPSQNSWGPDTSDQGQPFIRESMSHVWTDQEMLIWGGWDGGAYLQSGARYSPESDSWTDTNEADAPLGRANHVTLWTGKELFVWGGCGGMVCMNEYADGARYAPSSDSWLPVPTSGGLSARQQTAGVWIGNEVVIFGGRSGNTPLGDGARAAL